MKYILTLFISLLSISGLYAQRADTAKSSNEDKLWTFVQQKPVFPGDINAYLSKHINYPKEAIKDNVTGTVYVQFIVEKDGSVSHVTILRGVDVNGGELLNKEALRVVSEMPKWTPGMQNGHTVRVAFMLPIKFSLH